MNDPPFAAGDCRGGTLVVCDFDGTVCSVDMCNEILERVLRDLQIARLVADLPLERDDFLKRLGGRAIGFELSQHAFL